jgi:c(7)-type cytochrome triheme protein
MQTAENDRQDCKAVQKRPTLGGRLRMKYALMLVTIIAACTIAGNAHAVASGVTLTFEGKGAGEVVFNGTVHAGKGLVCADCHERHNFSPALFPMESDITVITMRRMELGRSCGYCHINWVTDMLSCSRCHHK